MPKRNTAHANVLFSNTTDRVGRTISSTHDEYAKSVCPISSLGCQEIAGKSKHSIFMEWWTHLCLNPEYQSKIRFEISAYNIKNQSKPGKHHS
jgi:hypothetical protein